MDNAGSVTGWLIQLQQGTPDAVNALWDRYVQRLAGIVRGRLTKAGGPADGSDIALSAFDSFYRGVQEGKFADLRGRDQLWRVLVVIAERKAISQVRHENAKRRGGGKLVKNDALLSEIASSEPTPDVAAELLDEFHHLMEILRAEDPMLALIAARKCAGFSNQEIAAERRVAPRTIQRKLERISILWSEDIDSRFGSEE